MSQPQIKTDIEARVQDTGDTMTGDLRISTPGDSLPDLILQNSSGATGYSVLTKNASSTADYGTQLADYGSSGNSARFVIRADKAYSDLSNFIYVYCKDANNENAIYYRLLHSGNYTDYTLSKNNSIHMLSDVNTSANLGKYSSIFRTTSTNCDGVAPSTYSVVCRFRSGYNGSYDLWLSGDVKNNFYIAKTADGALTSSTSWKKIAIFDENNALSTNNYTNQSTVPKGGIKIHDIRSATVSPGAFGSYVANFYFDEEANGSWKTVMDLTGWTAGSYASHQIAFNSHNSVGTTEGSLYHRTGMSGTWQPWYKILDEKNYANYISGSFLPLSGGTLTGQLKVYPVGGMYINPVLIPSVNAIYYDASSANSSTYWSIIGLKFPNSTYSLGGERQTDMFGIYKYANTRTENGYDAGFYIKGGDNNFYCTTKLYGAVWNDYAEYRESEVLEPGRCIIETGKGDLILSTERLQPGANIISDTYGFAIGETDECKCPIAVSGRVLVYPYEDRYSYQPGDAVCSGPNGTISKMSNEEIMKYPHRIVGTVSEIPEYDTWGTGNVKVNNRIWIKVK